MKDNFYGAAYPKSFVPDYRFSDLGTAYLMYAQAIDDINYWMAKHERLIKRTKELERDNYFLRNFYENVPMVANDQ